MGAVTVLEKAPDIAPAKAFLKALLLLEVIEVEVEVVVAVVVESSFDEETDSDDGLVTNIILSTPCKDGVVAIILIWFMFPCCGVGDCDDVDNWYRNDPTPSLHSVLGCFIF